jgi:hypothetical protein
VNREELTALRDAIDLTLALPDNVRALLVEPEPDLTAPEPPAAHPPWVRSISDYDRKETTVVEGLRYG